MTVYFGVGMLFLLASFVWMKPLTGIASKFAVALCVGALWPVALILVVLLRLAGHSEAH